MRWWQRLISTSDVARVWLEPRSFSREVLERSRTRIEWVGLIGLNLALVIATSGLYVRSGALAAQEGLSRIVGVFRPPLWQVGEKAAEELAFFMAGVVVYFVSLAVVCFLFRVAILKQASVAALYVILAANVLSLAAATPFYVFHGYFYSGMGDVVGMVYLTVIAGLLVASLTPTFIAADELFIQRSATLTAAMMLLVAFVIFVAAVIVAVKLETEPTPNFRAPGTAGLIS